MDTMELVRDGNTASVTRNTPPTDHGNTPIRLSIPHVESMVVRSFSISTLASAGILTADSFGVIRFRNRNIRSVSPVSAAEQKKKIPAAILVDEEPPMVMMEAMGGKTPENPWPVMMACVYN